MFDKNGKEINWIDPYDWHKDVTSESMGLVFGERQYRVSNIVYEYDVVIPKGGGGMRLGRWVDWGLWYK